MSTTFNGLKILKLNNIEDKFLKKSVVTIRRLEKTILSLDDMTVINVSHVIFKDTKEQYDKIFTVKKSI